MKFAGVVGLLLGLMRCNGRLTISKLYSVIGARLACQDIGEYLILSKCSERDKLHYGSPVKGLVSTLNGAAGDPKAWDTW
jgi:hypothetical protein